MAAAREIPDLETQRKEISQDMRKSLREGDTWYLVDLRWFKQWKKYVGFDTWDQSGAGDKQNNPGPIDNSCLLEADARTLKKHLIDELDYNVLPEDVWLKLLLWYGVTSHQQALPRKVVECGLYVKNRKFAVYLMEFKLSQHSDPQTLITREFTVGDTVGQVMSEMKKVFNIPEDTETRVWNKYMSHSRELLTNLEQTVYEAGLRQGQVLVIEQKNEDGTWQSQSNKSLSLSSKDKKCEKGTCKQKGENSKTKKAVAKKSPLKQSHNVETRELAAKSTSNCGSRASGISPTQFRETEQGLNSLKEQLRKKEEQVTSLSGHLRQTEEQRDTLQRQYLNDLEQHLTDCKGQLREREFEQTMLHEQLREKEEYKENLERQLREVEQQLREKNEQEGNLQRQLRDMEEQLTNCQRQLQERDLRETSLQEQLREKEQEQENSQRELREMEQRMTNCEEQTERREEERTHLEQQVTSLERQLRAKDEELSELELSLSTAQQTINEQRRQETCDWVIPRSEIQMTNKCLGKGGWGVVNEGTYCGCAIAVKQIHELILSPHNRRLFEREMNIASRCRHPCLLQFIGATNDEASPLFVTELMETSLRALLGQRQLSESVLSVISLDVSRALNYLHQKNIVHRDVSSANVLLWRQGEQWRGKVSDYGTANFMQQTMTVAPGALVYSAPEALTSNQTDKVDVYSFGVLLCEMCIRELPEPKRREEQVALMTNRAFRGLVRRCLQTDPAQRPNMGEIIQNLEQLLPTSQ